MKIKVRQISQGVEDLNWKNKLKESESSTAEIKEEVLPPQDANRTDNDDMNAEPTTMVNGQDTLLIVQPEAKTTEGHITQTLSSVPNGSATRRDSESEKEKGLKRKYLERGTSAGPQDGDDGVKPTSESIKRPRDDADKDDNPRETKRPSPPPEKTGTPTISAPKPVRFIVLNKFSG
jgi:Ran-binding protein 3